MLSDSGLMSDCQVQDVCPNRLIQDFSQLWQPNQNQNGNHNQFAVSDSFLLSDSIRRCQIQLPRQIVGRASQNQRKSQIQIV